MSGLGLLLVAAGLHCAHKAEAPAPGHAKAGAAAAPVSSALQPYASAPPPPTAADVAPTALVRKPLARDALDLDLLAEIARQTGAPPSASVLRLVAMHEQGSSRAQLRRAIERDLEQEIRVQLAARRWLRRISGEPLLSVNALPPAPNGPRHVQRLHKLQRE